MESEEQKQSQNVDEEYSMSFSNPKNLKLIHEIVIDSSLEQTKDFSGFMRPEVLTQQLNKSMKMKRCFKKAEFSEEFYEKNPNADQIYMNTYRNSFVSALAMAYNFHLPLVLSPNAVWLAVLQGLSMYFQQNPDKEYMKLVFKDYNQIGKTSKKILKIKDDNWHPDISKIRNEKFDEPFFQTINKSVKKIWNEKHSAGKDIVLNPDNDLQNFVKMEQISDIFQYFMSSEYDIMVQKEDILNKEYQQALKKANDTKSDPPQKPNFLSDKDKEKLKAQSLKEQIFYNTVFGLSSLNTIQMESQFQKEQNNCGIPKVKFEGTLRDWKILKKKITYLDRFGCHKWLDVLLPVINKFIAAIEIDQVDKEFWNAIYSIIPAQTQNSKNKVHGWICNFFPYTAKEPKEQFSYGNTMKKMFSERGTKYISHMMDEDDFHRGVSACIFNINKKDYTLASGFVGVEFINEVIDPKYPDEFAQSVKPALGWVLYEEDESLAKQHPQVFISADTSGNIFK